MDSVCPCFTKNQSSYNVMNKSYYKAFTINNHYSNGQAGVLLMILRDNHQIESVLNSWVISITYNAMIIEQQQYIFLTQIWFSELLLKVKNS